MRGFRDRDFIQTTEGFFFCVVGSTHPPERAISYIKYVPSKSGVWGNADNRFSRILQKYTIPNLLQTFNYLEENYPQYLFHSPADNIKITVVPLQNIKQHFKPEEKLAQLRQTSQLDSLQKMLIRFTQFLEEKSGIPQTSFGVTGSLLLDIHQPTFSDLDITVYGTKNSWALQKALTKKRSNGMRMCRLEGDALKEWAIKKTENYPLTASEASKIYARKWNLGTFENRWVSIHPVKLENEVTEEYGETIYQPIGQVTIQAVVCDNTDSLFLPAVYKIKDVTVLEGTAYENINEIVSYESLYDSLAENDETIQAKGKLELATEKGSSNQHYRVVVGSAEGKGKEYIKMVD
jgi:predicted nucleotidyltransferase